MKIIFGFSKGKGCKPFSKIIQIVENREYSHVYIKYIDELTGDKLVFQASHGMVNVVSEEIFLQESIIVEEYEMSVSLETYLKIRKKMNKLLGLVYGFGQLFNILLQKIFKSKDIKLIENGDKQFICSELGYVILNEAYPSIISDQDNLTPSNFNAVINKIGIKRTA